MGFAHCICSGATAHESLYWQGAMQADGQMCSGRIGDYLLDEKDALGEGAFGKVYKAEHVYSAIPVAVKKVAKQKTKFDELNAVRNLSDEHVISIIDLCVNDAEESHVYIVLELCDCDLNVHLTRQKDARLNNADLDCVTESLARGYFALYEKCIIHRDIKPENILLKYACTGEIAVAKIGDFGTSRLMDEEQCDQGRRALTSLAGTPLYMAAEIGANILEDRCYDAKVDMWSVGVVLYQCVNGKVPFDESALCRLFLFAANRNYEGYSGPPSPWPQSASAPYRSLINRLLELNVDDRLSPPAFYCLIVHKKILIDQSRVIEGEDSDGDWCQYPLETAGLCCNGIEKGRNTVNVENCEDNNNHNGDQKCNNCSSHSLDLVIQKNKTAMQNRSGWPAIGVSYILEQCAWFFGTFVACNYCCFSMRHYGYEI